MASRDEARSGEEVVLFPLAAGHLVSEPVVEGLDTEAVGGGPAAIGQVVPIAPAAQGGARRDHLDLVAHRRVGIGIGDGAVGPELLVLAADDAVGPLVA